MPCAGTLICASDDVLTAMAGDDAAGVSACKQQDLVAFVKTCYLMTHPYALDQYQLLGAQLQEPEQSRAQRVEKVKAMWARLLDARTPAGRKWGSLIDLAHVERNGTADGPSYLDVLRKLHSGTAELLPGHM